MLYKIFIPAFLIIPMLVILISYFLFRPQTYNKPENVYTAGHFRTHNYSYLNPSLPTNERINDLLERMTVSEKIGQMALVEKNSIHDPLDVARYGLGAVMSGGGGNPEPNTPEAWLAMVNKFQAASQRSRLGIPILYGVDVNHGHTNVLGATIFPHFIGLGATHDPELVRRVAQTTAEEMQATGIYWGFSPCLDVALDKRWGRMYETFGSDTKNIQQLGRAYVDGFQDKLNGSTAATAKHYLGVGAMRWGTSINKEYFIDQGETMANEITLRAIHLPPFKEAVQGGVMSIMVGLNTWQGTKLSASHHLLTDVLKNELKFSGIVLSDWYGIYGISSSKYKSVVAAINAGVDMPMLPFDYKSFIQDTESALKNGDISHQRLNDAVRRILKVKFELGLFDELPEVDLKIIGSNQHRQIAREAVRKSLVILKDEDKILPLKKNPDKILVAGSAADNLGKQAGGWTVEWQGIDGNWISGTTILSAIKKAAANETNVLFNEQGYFAPTADKADIGIAIVGEEPYAEGVGDNKNPSLSEKDLATIEKLRTASEQLIVIIISGRPLDLKKYAPNWDAIIAAWLPGSEGDGVADVLFGDYPFTGQLPVVWKL